MLIGYLSPVQNGTRYIKLRWKQNSQVVNYLRFVCRSEKAAIRFFVGFASLFVRANGWFPLTEYLALFLYLVSVRRDSLLNSDNNDTMKLSGITCEVQQRNKMNIESIYWAFYSRMDEC